LVWGELVARENSNQRRQREVDRGLVIFYTAKKQITYYFYKAIQTTPNRGNTHETRYAIKNEKCETWNIVATS
jgi:hypothetical protein